MTTTQVDLSQLAIDRGQAGRSNLHVQRHLVTRYLIPVALLAGFAAIVAWASRDAIFPPLDVQVVPVNSTQQSIRAGGTPLFNAAGWIEPRPTPVRVPGLAPGVVEQLLVVEDQFVKAGDPVAELVKDDARLILEMALADQKLREAELKHAEASIVAAETRYAQPVHLEAQLAQSDAALATINTEIANLPFELKRARSRLQYAQSDFERNVNASDSVSNREVEEARTQVETMQAMVDELLLRDSSLEAELTAITARRNALRVQLDLLVDEIQDRDQAIAQAAMAQARLEQSVVAVAEARLQFNRMTVRAPVDGRVLLLVGQPGTRIGGMRDSMSDMIDGSTVVTMYRPEMLQVKVDVRFEDIPEVVLGQPVRIDNPALNEPLTGNVLFVSSEADIQKNTLEVKVAIENPPAIFKPEMLVDVTFLAPESQTQGESGDSSQQWRIYIPKNLITNSNGTTSVWIADRSGGVAKRVDVITGEPGPDGMIEIVGGLDISSRVITGPLASLKDGMRIRFTEETSD